MAKGAEHEIYARRYRILEKICKSIHEIEIKSLVDSVRREFNVSEETVTKDLDALSSEGFPIEKDRVKVWMPARGMLGTWVNTAVGGRIKESEQKRRLAEATFIFIKKNKKQIDEIIAGTGSTAYRCVQELIDNEKELGNMKIHTANLLVLHCAVYHKSKNFFVEVPNGELDLERAALKGDHISDYFQGLKNVDAVITSFSDMSFEEGFRTEFTDKNSKLADLLPNKSPKCKWIIIPIEWLKIGRAVGNPVAASRGEQLDFADGRRKYVIITDKPSETDWDLEVDGPKLEDLQKWQKEYGDGVEIVYA